MKREHALKTHLPNWVIPLMLFLGTFVLYVHHLSPDVYGGDSGDFLSAIAVRGVAHPSGYPLYTILGILFSFLPAAASLAWKVGLISALSSSLTVVLFYHTARLLVKHTYVAVMGALTLAFLFPFWLYAEVPEVFALHHFFLLLIFYLGVRAYETKQPRFFYALCASIGLSLSNHELTIFLFAPLALLLRRSFPTSAKQRLASVGFFLLGLTPYLYIPIAAAAHPAVNWNAASTLDGFLRLVTRADYGWLPHGGKTIAVALVSLQYYVSYLTLGIPVMILGVSALGMLALIKKGKSLYFFVILTSFLLFGPVFAFYNSSIALDILHMGIYEKFYASSILFLLLFFTCGIMYVTELVTALCTRITPALAKTIPYRTIILLVFAAVPLSQLAANINKTDLHTLTIGDTLGENVLRSLPAASMVTVQNDTILFNARYVQHGKRIRQDVTLLTPAEAEKLLDTDQFLLPKHTEGAGSARPLFVFMDNYADLAPSVQRRLMPYGLLLRVVSDAPPKESFIADQQAVLSRFPGPSDFSSINHLLLIADTPLWYARAYANTGRYLITAYADYQAAFPYFQKAIALHKDTDAAHMGLGDYWANVGDCKKAKIEYEEAIRLSPVWPLPYFKLYTITRDCLGDTQETKRLEDIFARYPNIFRLKEE